MQAVAKRHLETVAGEGTREETTVDPAEAAAILATFQRQMEDERDDFLDDNDLERILSRPALTRWKLDLFEAPEFVQRLSSYQEAEVGDKVTFSGQYKAFPKPTVKWFKDEEEIKNTSRHELDLTSETSGIVRLIIRDLIKQDEGAYKCKVENQEGVASTTGYLSVSGKPSEKGHSLQTKKIAQDKVSTPPYLRPIAEQKSMEEREEKEYEHLPPSPLQEFMDKIRHSAKSMHGPIVYGNLDLISDDDIINDFENDTEEDVFDEDQNSSTPTESPVDEPRLEGLVLRENPQLTQDTTHIDDKDNSSVKVIDVFISPSVKLTADAVTTQMSNEDSAYDSDNRTNDDNARDDRGIEENNMKNSNRCEIPRESLQNRRTKLALQRCAAVEIPDFQSPDSPTQQPVSKVHVEPHSQTQITAEENNSINNANVSKTTTSVNETMEETKPGLRISPVKTLRLNISQVNHQRSSESSESLTDCIFQWIESSWMQFFVGLVAGSVSVSLAFDVPLSYVIPVIALISIISFQILERHQSTGQQQ